MTKEDKVLVLSKSNLIQTNRNSSKGNQLKWKKDNIWYKVDFLGYEALSEFVISKMLQKTNVPHFVSYSLCIVKYCDKEYIGCASQNFLKDGWSLVTLSKLFSTYLHTDIYEECERLDRTEKDCIEYIVNNVKAITGLNNFGKYLTILFEMDAFFFNEDRHFNNIAVLYNANANIFDYCPIFDNGAGLFSDLTIAYDLKKSLSECRRCVTAKPISPSFFDQIEAAENLYGSQFNYWFTEDDIKTALNEAKSTGLYSDEIINRVSETLFEQLRVYKCFSTPHAVPPLNFQNESTEEIERV